MRSTWVNRVGIVTLVGALVLSVGLVRLIFMADRALAEKDDKGDKGRGSATDLSGVTQNWDKNLPSASRFTVLADFGGAAVRDNNTGLVWEQAPDATIGRVWPIALAYCLNKPVGGTRGWRLPSVVELASLIDPSLPAPFVPTSVFTGVQAAFIYWSATLNAADPSGAWGVPFNNSAIVNVGKADPNVYVWCVRGPMNADAY
jgi:hypothetical protein